MLHQKVHLRVIFGNVGLLLHVPGIMATISLGICLIFQESYAYLPFILTAVISFGLGQLLYRCCFVRKASHLWDAMIIAAIGWVICSIIGAFPFCWIAIERMMVGLDFTWISILSKPVNALFESFSGFTSTGLTMIDRPEDLPYILQWWRSLLQWTGGMGLILFILSLTHLKLEGYQLYYSEAHTERLGSSVTRTAQIIWGIYLIYTCFGIGMFALFGMPIWESINHAMTFIATGGFSTIRTSFQNYSVAIQVMGIVLMVIGAMSFSLHYKLIREGRFRELWKNLQNRLLYILLIVGGINVAFISRWNITNISFIDGFFEWSSALTTCGFSTISLSVFSPMGKLFLIVGMVIGGCSGSTSGGLKISRLIYLFEGIFLRVKTITLDKEESILKKFTKKAPRNHEPSGIDLPKTEKTERLFAASVLFFLWVITLLLGTFLLLTWAPEQKFLDACFDVVSAMSNVGLSTGVMNAEFPWGGKYVFMFLMWIGRLEIIPALILFLSIPISVYKRKR